MDATAKRNRASKPKVRTGCLTCKTRRIKCDEGKPECKRCKASGRTCDGYLPPESTMVMIPKQLLNVPTVTLPGEPRALEFFFHKSAPQLAGFFESSFWKGSVLQLSLAEPAIRQAIAAIGCLHEQQGLRSSSSTHSSPQPDVAVHLYSRAIRLIIAKTTADPDALPAVTMASIIFTCFELLRGNAPVVSSHATSGVNLLRLWREKTRTQPVGPWGQRYASFESHFMEIELAPILSLFNLNITEFSLGQRSHITLNAVDGETGHMVFADQFETLREARVGLVDLITTTAILFRNMEGALSEGQPPSSDFIATWSKIRRNVDRWKAKFDDLTRRHQETWDNNKERKSAADVVRIMWCSINIGTTAYINTDNEIGWDSHRPDFEEILHLATSLLSDPDRYADNNDNLSKILSLDLGLIFPLHAVAWKCRWPSLRRRGLDLLRRCPKREWLLESEAYHAVFTRIMEIEEDCLHMGPGVVRDEDVLPPAHVRVLDFHCVPTTTASPSSSTTSTAKYCLHTITFITKPNGPEAEPHFRTEQIWLPTSSEEVGEVAPLTNLLSVKQWVKPEATDLHTAGLLNSAVLEER